MAKSTFWVHTHNSTCSIPGFTLINDFVRLSFCTFVFPNPTKFICLSSPHPTPPPAPPPCSVSVSLALGESMNSSERNKTGCFSTILHRLLCTGSCQTYPSDHISETDRKKSLNYQNEDPDSSKVQIKEQNTPGIVARLMGLESLPEISWVSKRDKNADISICRSRSVNSVQCLLEFDLSEALHRRVRTSVSFRELLMLPQNSHGSLLNDETKDIGLKDYEMGHFEVGAERRKNKENVREGVVGKRCNGGKNKKCSKKNEESSKIYPKASSEARNFRGSAKDLGFANSRSVMASKVEKPVKHGNKKDLIDVTALPGKRCRHADKKVEGSQLRKFTFQLSLQYIVGYNLPFKKI